MDKKVIKTKNAPEAIGPYSQAIQAGEFIFCSGQIPINPKTGDHIKGSPSEQARQVLQNITGILEETGCTLEDVVKVTVYLTSMDFFKEVNETYKEFFKINPPARVAVAVSALPLGFNVEMDAIAKTR
ncbi:MAG: RidA family protein [Caldisericales bacterium]|nr:RidA family protein [Caldisericia bacterium]NMD14096.1 RidA family protein [Caldisericales bacterium]